MKGPGFDLASLMGGIMMPPAPPMNSNAIREESLGDDISDIISVSGDSTGGELREVRMGGSSKKKGRGGAKKNAVSL